MAEFKKISETDLVAEPNENDRILLESDGFLKRIRAVDFASLCGGGVSPIHLIKYGDGSDIPVTFATVDGSITFNTEETITGLYMAWMTGTPVFFCSTSVNPGDISITSPYYKWEMVRAMEMGQFESGEGSITVFYGDAYSSLDIRTN